MIDRPSRRRFIGLAAAGAGAAALGPFVLAGCDAGTPDATGASVLTPSSSPGTVGGPGAAASTLTAGPAPTDAGFSAPPLLGRPTDRSITVNSLPSTTTSFHIEYGTAAGRYERRTPTQDGVAGRPVESLVGGLEPGTRYYYRVVTPTGPGADRTFVTRRAPGTPFVFTVQGDSHPERAGKQFDAGLYVRTLGSTAADDPDFSIAMGDDFSVDTLKTVNASTVRDVYLRQRPWLGLVGAPWFLVNGNHEQASRANLDGTPDNVAVWAQTSRNSLYPQPAPDGFYTGDTEVVPHIGSLRDYFAFTWGDLLLIFLDPYWHTPGVVDNAFGADRTTKAKRNVWDNTIGEAQYRWFAETLRSATARHIVVVTHHVNGTGRGGATAAKSYEWGDAAGYRTNRPTWPRTIHQLMVDHGVSLFLQGHDHVFAHEVVDGVNYQTLPDPANTNPSSDNADAYPGAVIHPNSGHLRIGVDPDRLRVEYVRSFLDRSDEVAYAYEVR